MNLAFCINEKAFIGLGPTLSSLIRNCEDSKKLKIYFLCSCVSIREQRKISQLLKKEKYEGDQTFIDFDAFALFGKLNSLHGDWTTYGLLLLAEFIADEKVLYLDADLIIETDVLELATFDLGDSPLAAVAANTIQHSLDNVFLNGILKIPLEIKYFNAGILYFNLDYWRVHYLKEKCLELAMQYADKLISHDQTLLNALFGSTFKLLPRKFNCAWYAHSKKPVVSENMIIHFLGSPKPWDPGAKVLHNAHTFWKSYLDEGWQKDYYRFNINSFQRIWKLRKSYFRVIRKKTKYKI